MLPKNSFVNVVGQDFFSISTIQRKSSKVEAIAYATILQPSKGLTAVKSVQYNSEKNLLFVKNKYCNFIIIYQQSRKNGNT